jgi:hypothetical protein
LATCSSRLMTCSFFSFPLRGIISGFELGLLCLLGRHSTT